MVKCYGRSASLLADPWNSRQIIRYNEGRLKNSSGPGHLSQSKCFIAKKGYEFRLRRKMSFDHGTSSEPQPLRHRRSNGVKAR
ncbi:hypothetical protein TNCV_1643291 [Trichonephila clavipes]|nr:hypothetical protein TNCV_1643291 [Trichonephila clavipes]